MPLILATPDLISQPFDVSAATTLSIQFEGVNDTQPEANERFESQAPLYSEWGLKKSKRLMIDGRLAIDIDDTNNQLSCVGIEAGYFVENNLSVNFALHILDVEQSGKDAIGLNPSAQLRWHFIAEDKWSMFIEGGAGFLRTSANVPSGGSQFNFTVQIGTGFSFDAGNQNRWLVGARWHHISNANTYNNNPGRDNIMLWAGLSMPY
ncbi:MAG: acyloxyacyl hydrolase [Planctomycetota bacterium]|nr:acyloxyacyl hydrolase [Planctomycetota bacterium]